MEEQQQEKHWQNAQSLEIGLDLISAARSQLRLLSAVDSHPLDLYHGSSVERAISRYEDCWLPLLAKHGPYTGTGAPLIPPLDCAWIWHCHRLNPVQYISDCKACYGKLLDASTIPIDNESEAVAYTTQLWNSLFSDEEYEVPFKDPLYSKASKSRKINYDLQAAVERQSSFYYQVSRPHMEEERFLQAALQRYKGFLYLLKLSGLRLFLVPTYDIDLMWHSHQANPGVYQEDTVKLLGRVLNHDDTDSDRTEGQKLDTGFNKTRDMWQRTFGSSYERAGAMYRGEAPALPRLLACAENPIHCLTSWSLSTFGQSVHGVEPRKIMQVFITVQKARNLHISQDAIVAVQLSLQRRCNTLKLETSWTKATLNPDWNGFWSFECEEATQGIRLELRSCELTCCNLITKPRVIGAADVPWRSLLSSPTLSFDGWVPLVSKSQLEADKKPTSIKVSISVTTPVTAPVLLRMENSFFRKGKKNQNSIMVFDHRNEKKFVVKVSGEGASETFKPSLIHVYSIGQKDTPVTLLGRAKYTEPATTLTQRDGGTHLAIPPSLQGYHPALRMSLTSGDSEVTVLHGRKCQFEVPGSSQAEEADFLTIFCKPVKACVGKATALLNWKSGAMEISGEQCTVMMVLLCAIMRIATETTYHTAPCKLLSLLRKLRRGTCIDDWGAIILNRRSDLLQQDELRFVPWFSMSSDVWMSMFYNVDFGYFGNWTHSLWKLSGGCGQCGDGGGCGGCGAGGCGCGNSSKSSAGVSRGGGCGGCGSGGCGGCGGGGCGKNVKSIVNGKQGGGCGGCGAGGCMNSVQTGGIGEQLLKPNTMQGRGGGCGGCGNSVSTALFIQGGKCGGCGAGGCGNSIMGRGVQGGKCGGCGSGGCGNSMKGGDVKAVQGGKCGGCGAGGCGNSVMVSERKGIQGGKCGGCGSGGCGNSMQNQ